MTIARLSAFERRHFRTQTLGIGKPAGLSLTEPALGTVAQRLDILILRLGGRISALPGLTGSERAEYAELLAHVMAGSESA